jgi:hypothetical protein
MNLPRWLLSAGLAANGACMLAAPHAWYGAVPGVIVPALLTLALAPPLPSIWRPAHAA